MGRGGARGAPTERSAQRLGSELLLALGPLAKEFGAGPLVGDRALPRRGVVTVVPVTSSTSRVLPFQVLLPAAASGLRVESKAQAEQVGSVAVERLGPVLGSLPRSILSALDDALRLHLDL